MSDDNDNSRYQPYYCEENIWHLCRDRGFEERRAFVVFISNEGRSCALWSQRAAPQTGVPVVWDYHVVAIDASGNEAQVWDLDTVVGAPVDFGRWWKTTFPLGESVPERLRPTFRVVEADTYLERFSSDRSHMRDDDGGWKKPPPDWEPIFEADEGMNLERFVAMDDDFVGEVLEMEAFCRRFQGTADH